MSAGFNFNNITLQDTADITKVMQNFEEIEANGITYAEAKQKATTIQDGIMSKEDKEKLDTLNSGANGTITGITAGTGLTGGGTTDDVTLNVAYGTTANTACEGNDSRLSNARTPLSHASNATNYGAGSTTKYGHVKIIDNLNSTTYADGEVLSAKQGNVLNTSKEDVINKITSITANSTDTQYASAKAIFSLFSNATVVGSYTGDGNKTNSHFANLGYVPRLLICTGYGDVNSSSLRYYADVAIFISTGEFHQITMNTHDGYTYYKNSDGDGDGSLLLSVTSTGLTIYSTYSRPYWLNVANKKYTYFIIK